MAVLCPTVQDTALCGIVASTNVGSVYTEWSCNSAGVPLTDPCGTLSDPSWRMLICANGEVTGITNFTGFSGSFPSSVNGLSSLRELSMFDNDFISGESETVIYFNGVNI